MLNRLSVRTLLATSVLTLCACANEAPETIDLNAPDVSEDGANIPLESIFDTAVATGTFTTLVSALEASGIATELADESKTFTVFAATDAAFEKLGTDTVNALLGDTDTLSNVLRYHVVVDKAIASAEATGRDGMSAMVGAQLEMSNGDKTSVTFDGSNFHINMSKVIVTDVMASNGIIHVIDTVLSPPVVEPTPLNIVEKIVEEGSFNELSQALVATGLTELLSNTNDTYTLLAPTDEAFAKLSSDTKNALFSDPEMLRNTLLYHVVDGEAIDSVGAIRFSGQQKLMSNGANAAIYLINGELKINEATVTRGDLTASNGIIHALDTVLTPPPHTAGSHNHQYEAVGSIFHMARNTPDFSMFAHAVDVADLEDALGCPIDLYTAFIPNNEAFKSLSEATRNHLFSDPVAMRQVILAHLLPGSALDSASAMERLGFNLLTGNGSNVVIKLQYDSLWVNKAKILRSDITTVNGIVHVIDQVIMP